MQEAWIPLECTDCGTVWEGTPASLPKPGTEFSCPYCDAQRRVVEFIKTEEGRKILERFHGSDSIQ